MIVFDAVGDAPPPAAPATPAPSRTPPLPRATLALAVTIVLVFGAQVAAGGTGMLGLVRAGAQYPDSLVGDRAVWTLFTPTLLHLDVLHLVLNVTFLVVCGGRVEATIGPARTLLVFFAGGVVGNLASALLVQGVGAGASGGGWGLMVAELLLVAFPALRQGAPAPGTLRASGQLLAFNGVVSLLPGVDGLAHLGGGLGGVLALLGTHALVQPWPPTATVAAVVHAVALGWAWSIGRPWTLADPPSPSADRTVLEGLVVVPAPPELAVDAEAGTIGRVAWDPVVIEVALREGLGAGSWMDQLVDAWALTGTSEVPCGPRCYARRGTAPSGVEVVAWSQSDGTVSLTGLGLAWPTASDAWRSRLQETVGALRWTPFGAIGAAGMLEEDPQAAVALLERTLSEAPDDPALLNSLAWRLATGPAEVRDPARAVRLAERAVAAGPDDANVLDTLAAAYEAAGDVEPALATAERALVLAPGTEAFRERVTRLRARLGR